MKQGKYDVAIVGAGIGGMCSAALMSHYGYKVLVVEKLPQPGGRMSNIEYKGYKIPHVAQEQSLIGPTSGIFKEVGAEFELVVDQPPPVYRIGGQDYPLPPKGGIAFIISKICRDEAEMIRIGNALRRAAKWEVGTGSTISLYEWLLQFTDNELIMQLFQAIVNMLMMTTIYELSARDFIGYYNRGLRQWSAGGRPLRGNMSLIQSLARVINGKGSDIWVCAEVKKILTNDGVVTGILVAKDGDEIEINARAVISNVGPKETIGLVGAQNLDKGYLKEIEENVRHASQMLIAFCSDKPLIEYASDLVLLGARRVVTILPWTLTCPEVSPPGKYLLAAQCQPKSTIGPIDPKKEIEAAMEDLREHIPGFDRDAEILNVSCFFNPDWPGLRNLPGYNAPQRTPIENLYNVGDGVAPFGENATPGSALTARMVTEDIRNRIKPEAA